MNDTANEGILSDRNGPVAILTINRPDKHNSVTLGMRAALASEIRAADRDADVRVIVLRGAGEKAFCAGADLAEVKGRTMKSDWSNQSAHFRHELPMVIEECRKPTIGALRGYVVGLGLEIALACSLRVASTDAVFRLPELQYGIIPGSGATQRLPRLIGLPWAMDMLLTGRKVDAQFALSTGLVTRTTDPERLMDEALSLAKGIAEVDPAVVSVAKIALQRGGLGHIREDLEFEQLLSTFCIGVRD